MSKILVPIDGSGESHAALPYAVRMARLLQSEIVLVGVAERAYDELEPGRARQALLDHLEKVREAFAKLGIAITVQTGAGAPAEEITRLAEEGSVDLIVMSTHGRRGTGRWLLGGVTARVVREAGCPVLIARPGEHQPGEAHDKPFRRILVPLDRSPLAERALDAAARLATRDESQVGLLGVVDFPTWLCFQTEERWSKNLPAATESYLAAQTERLQAQGLKAYAQVCIGDPAEKILEHAETGVDLIVMATHGHSGVARTIMGSVAERIMQHAPCPVLFVREHRGALCAPGIKKES